MAIADRACHGETAVLHRGAVRGARAVGRGLRLHLLAPQGGHHPLHTGGNRSAIFCRTAKLISEKPFKGGVDIGDVDAKALKMEVAVGGSVDEASVKAQLLGSLDAGKKDRVAKFVTALYRAYVDLYFTYLEINPLVVTADKIYILDLAAKVTSALPSLRHIEHAGIGRSNRYPSCADRLDGRLHLPRQVGQDRVPAAVRARRLPRGGLHRRHRRQDGRLAQADHPQRQGPHLDDGGGRRRLRHLLGHRLRARRHR